MAIIVEEEKQTTNIVRFFGWLLIVVILIVAAYYIFFSAPELVVISPPAGLQTITPISQANIAPQAVLASPAYAALQAPPFPLPSAQGPVPVGRTNPFVAP